MGFASDLSRGSNTVILYRIHFVPLQDRDSTFCIRYSSSALL